MVSLSARRPLVHSWLSLRLLLFIIGMMHFVFVASLHAYDLEKDAARESQDMISENDDTAAQESQKVMTEEDPATIKDLHDNHSTLENEAAAESHAAIYPDQVVSNRLSIETKHWEFGVHVGLAHPLKHYAFSILANNSNFLQSDPGTPGEDEFSENGLTPPDFNGQTLLSGTLGNTAAVGGQLYYKVVPFIAIGAEGTYSVQQDLSLTGNGGPFTVPIYTTRYKVQGSQGVLALRLGDWTGPFRLYAMAGGGPYILNQGVTAELNDPDDAQHPPVGAASRTDIYASALYGGGLDIRVSGSGSIGISVQMQSVFTPNGGQNYFLPTAHFTFHFF